MPKLTKTRKSAKDRKAEIVETAIRLSAELGPDRITTQKLADTIGVTQPAIFRHFASKGMIWQAVAESITKRMQVGGSPTNSSEQYPDTALQQLVGRHLRYIQENPAIPAILFSRELHADNDELRAHFAAMMDNRQAVFADILRRGVEAGIFNREVDTDDAAYLVVSLIQGLAMRWSLSGRCFDLAVEGEKLINIQMRAFR